MGGTGHDEKTQITSVDGPPPPAAGDSVGTYRLLKQLGTGGMGSVFLAEHSSIGRRVAMKFLLSELCQYPDIVGRFFDEARSVNRINHENIVEVFDFVREPSGLSYLVMELLEGTDLYQTRKRDGPYAIDRILVICEQVASALYAAHKVGIIHRDLKPENVFLIKKRGSRDFVKLLDFGLAKLSDELPVARLPTQAGIVMGTPGYMSPEQALGVKVDGRSDVFSLGVLIHWMLADKVPDGGPNSVAPEKSVRGDQIPEELRELVARCIRAKPEERPNTMGDVTQVLTELRRQIRGTEVLQVVARTPAQNQPRSPSTDNTQIQPPKKGSTDDMPVITPSGVVEAVAHGWFAPRSHPPQPTRTSLGLLLVVGLGSAALALGAGYLIFGPAAASSVTAPGGDRPPERPPEHSPDEPKALAPTSDLPRLPVPPPASTGSPSTPDSAAKNKPKKKPAPHPSPP